MHDITLLDSLLVLAAYLLGSVSSAVITCRAMGLPDPRSSGSRNPGATNVLRLGGRRAAALTLAGDLLKGLVPVFAGHAAGAGPAVLAAIGAAAFLGHLFPLYFGFQGGKGVATFLGVLLGLSWPAGLATVATWLAVAAFSRISSLSALVATAASPLFLWWSGQPTAVVATVAALVLLLYWRHAENIRRLLAGTEGRIGGRGGAD